MKKENKICSENIHNVMFGKVETERLYVQMSQALIKYNFVLE